MRVVCASGGFTQSRTEVTTYNVPLCRVAKKIMVRNKKAHFITIRTLLYRIIGKIKSGMVIKKSVI